MNTRRPQTTQETISTGGPSPQVAGGSSVPTAGDWLAGAALLLLFGLLLWGF